MTATTRLVKSKAFSSSFLLNEIWVIIKYQSKNLFYKSCKIWSEHGIKMHSMLSARRWQTCKVQFVKSYHKDKFSSENNRFSYQCFRQCLARKDYRATDRKFCCMNKRFVRDYTQNHKWQNFRSFWYFTKFCQQLLIDRN